MTDRLSLACPWCVIPRVPAIAVTWTTPDGDRVSADACQQCAPPLIHRACVETPEEGAAVAVVPYSQPARVHI